MSLKKKTLGEANLKPMNLDDLNSIDDDDTGEVDFSEMYSSKPKQKLEPLRASDNEIKESDIYEVDIEIPKLRNAPDEWNFYKPLSPNKAIELSESVMKLGLLNRIIAWEQEDGTYMILAGHNRVRAFRGLHEETNDERFFKIPARIYSPNSIDQYDAREIIIDSNWAQRDLSPSEKIRSIVEKTKIYTEKSKYDKTFGRVRDVVAERHGMKGRMVANYIKLAELNTEFLDLLDKGELTIVNGLVLASYSEEDQEWLFERFGETWTKNTIKGIRPGFSKKQLEALILKNNGSKTKPFTTKTSKVTVVVPYGREVEISELLNKWKKDNDIPNEAFKVSFS